MSNDPGPVRDYYDLLNLFSDYCTSGYAADRQRPALRARPAPAPAPGTGVDDRRRALDKLAADIGRCTRCDLCLNRLTAVPGEGALDPLVMAVGEGPGADEDAVGRPFVGAAGQYFDKWLSAVGVSRERNVFIANIVKCRPPENRDPRPEEIKACFPYLEAQIELVRPRAIVTVGRVPSQVLLGETRGIGSLRGGSYFFRRIPLVPTYHPAAVLRDQALRGAVWEDLKRLKAFVRHV
jgi:uracil-DNA glycosylase